MDADPFRVFGVFRGTLLSGVSRGYISGGVAGGRCECGDFSRRFLTDGPWIAEGAGANRAQPLGSPWGFWFAHISSPVAQLVRRMYARHDY